ncbi:hypothetical protein MKW92_009091 [Papaver armeniacum]|nr:hypothetical protein MKW92_009091 [Papaver armeniacum]
MILKSFLLGNLLSLCMKIINSVVVVGLYYGFLTTFSIGPSYLFFLQARVMEEGTEKGVSATTGFITGRLMMFFYRIFCFISSGTTTKTFLIMDLLPETQCVISTFNVYSLNNLIFQLFNHFILPSSTLARLVNIYMFRCNNKMLFVTSSFVGWLIVPCVELRNSMARIFSILLFITCVYYLGRIPSPIVTKKLKEETAETEERVESEGETDVEIETISEQREGD